MKHTQTITFLSILSLVCLVGAGLLAPAFAHKGAKGVVKQRMYVMKNMKEYLKTIDNMVEKKIPFNDKKMQQKLDYIGRHGGVKMTKLFPKGTAHKPSEADPAIWKNWSDFEKMALALSRVSDEFRTSLADQQSSKKSIKILQKPYLSLRRSCKSCHDRFRE